MPDNFHDLIRDTLVYLKDPLTPKQTVLVRAEEGAYFQKREVPRSPPTQKREIPLPPQRSVYQEKPSQGPSPIKKALQRIVPTLKLVDQIPDDATAKRIATAWKEKIPDAEVVLLVCDSDPETLEFLKGLAKAIDKNLAKAKILLAERLEKEKRWDLFLEKNPLRLIIASSGMQKFPELIRFYRSIPANAQFFLDKTPLLVLSPVSIYKSLEHKAQLWKTLNQMLNSCH
jgi:hypothetical protein